MDFEHVDTRRYPVLSVEDSYAEWATTYDDTVQDEIDIRLLERSAAVPWPDIENAVDLACGTGRISAWLRGRGVRRINGVDLSGEMAGHAHAKNVYAALHKADVRRTGLQTTSFQLATIVLAECHLEELQPLYPEAVRLLATGGHLVLVGYHPHFLLKGVPTHFDRTNGDSIAIHNHIHLFSDHVNAAFTAGFELMEMAEGLIDET